MVDFNLSHEKSVTSAIVWSSLVEAMFFGCPVLCNDVVYNRETTHGKAYYWKDADELSALLERKDLAGDVLKAIAWEEYTWKTITTQYESLY